MPFALVIIGLLMVVTGAKDTYAQFAKQVAADFNSGSGCKPLQGMHQGCGFTWWLIAIGAIGSLGYVEQLRTFSRLFLVLIIVAMLVANRGFFNQFSQAIQQGPQAPAAPQQATAAGNQSTPVATVTGPSSAGAFGQPASDPGQAKFNTYMNYIFGSMFGG